MRVSRQILLTLIILTTVFATCISKTKRTKLHKILPKSARGHRKDANKLRGFKKDAVQRDNGMSYNQVADALNTNRLDSIDKDELSQLQDFNKQYINNEEASETALLADHGIDDNAALKISNMASLPSEFAPVASNMAAGNMAAGNMAAGNTASKTKIGNETAKQPQPAQENGDDDAALLKDAKSWPEYRFKDSDYSNYHFQEEVNNGPMGDNSAYGQPDSMYWQDEYGEPPHMKPRLSKPGQSDGKPTSVTSQKAQAQKQEDHVTDSFPIMSGKLGKPLAADSSSDMASPADKAQSANQTDGNTGAPSKSANKSSTNETSAAATAPLAKQTAPSQSSPGPSSDSAANPPAAHEAPLATEQPTTDTNTAVSQDKPTASNTSSTTNGQVAQSLKPQADSSKAIAKVLSGLVAGSEVQSAKGGATEGQSQGQSQSQGQGQAESHPQVTPGVQADGLNSSQVPKDTTSEMNHPRSHTIEQ